MVGKKNQKSTNRSVLSSTAVPKIAVRCGGSADPPSITSRPWNRAVLTGTFVQAGVGGAPVTVATVGAELIAQVCPGIAPANLEIRVRKIEAWGQELIANGVSYNSAVALNVYNFVGGTGVGAAMALSLQDAPAPNHRAHVHAKIAPYPLLGNSTQLLFQALVADGQSAMVHIYVDWRQTGAEGAGPLFAATVPKPLSSSSSSFPIQAPIDCRSCGGHRLSCGPSRVHDWATAE